MFCKQCGCELKDGAMFCANCGANQNPDAAETAQYTEQNPNNSVYQAPIQSQNAYNPNYGEAHNGQVGFGEAISLFFKNYINFSGRASKSEYWWVFLFNAILFFPLGFISSAIPPLGGLLSLGLMIPGISLAVRRLHDVGKSGAWYFIGLVPIAGFIILLIQLLKDSEGDNQWGPGPVAVANGSYQFVNTPVNNTPVYNAAPVQRTVTDNDIYAIAQNHEPVNANSPDAKFMMDSALGRIIPTYTGIENLAEAMMLCDPQSIKANIAATDTDTLIVVFKALDFYIGQGVSVDVLGMAQQNVLATLKTRL